MTSRPTPKPWRRMSTVPHDVTIEVRLTTDGTAVSPAIRTKVDDYGFYINRVYWARFSPDGRDRLAAWRPIK